MNYKTQIKYLILNLGQLTPPKLRIKYLFEFKFLNLGFGTSHLHHKSSFKNLSINKLDWIFNALFGSSHTTLNQALSIYLI